MPIASRACSQWTRPIPRASCDPTETSPLSYAPGASVLTFARRDSFGKKLWDAQMKGVGMSRLLWICLSASVQFLTTTTALLPRSGWTSCADSEPFPKNISGPSDPRTSRPQRGMSSFVTQVASSPMPRPKASTLSCHRKSSLAFQTASSLCGAWLTASAVLPGLCPSSPSPASSPLLLATCSAPNSNTLNGFPTAAASGSGEQVSSEGVARVQTAPAGPSRSHLHTPFIPTVYTLSSAINAFPGTAAG